MNILTGDRNMLTSIKVGTGYSNARLTVTAPIPPNSIPSEGPTRNSYGICLHSMP